MNQNKTRYVSGMENTANDTPLSLTLRQCLAVFRGPVFWIVLGAAILLAVMAGPYYTLERFSFPERLVHWSITIFLSTTLMTFLSIFAYRITEAHHWNWAVVAVIAGVAGILPVVGTIYLAEGITTGFTKGWLAPARFVLLLASVAPSLIAVTVVVNALIIFQHRELTNSEAGAEAKVDAQQRAAPFTLLQSKLPYHLGHDIVAVQAQDHYVEVTTPSGTAMVLMRLGDAVTDLAPLGGVQVHRSWWINLSHVERTEKGANGLELVLTSDQRIPVGRSFRQAVRASLQERNPVRPTKP